MIRVEVLEGAALDAVLDDLARLRIAVFRDFPYLYEGDMAYERKYVQVYRDSADAIVVAAYDGQRMVGASTGLPLEDHEDDFGAPLATHNIAEETVFYCAESVLLPEYRGHGLGHAFFDRREEKARALGRSHAMFCSVVRPEEHPARPADYRHLGPFWRKRGYTPLDGAVVTFDWKDIGDAEQSAKLLQVWIRAL
ncbi:GNAT family N-acetyltransferase [Algicella marina]|uniref:GNAT family N-acetyltransferase n=1 Tax=Algicella marina TaxID=2683284 RepID=A0A6P1SXI4_9RHOB|nr:GNAT family N-acetyltransferase [Algicella marina]QHQ35168.1 GNAT family N-acetyltransferase [Algicella marina]